MTTPTSTTQSIANMPQLPHESGIAASSGILGSGPSNVSYGVTLEPEPTTKPGPANQDTAQIMAVGKNASCPKKNVRLPMKSRCIDCVSEMMSTNPSNSEKVTPIAPSAVSPRSNIATSLSVRAR